jgi:hypothetical protein
LLKYCVFSHVIFINQSTKETNLIMRKSTLKNFLFYIGAPLLLLSSCKDDSYLDVPPPVPDQSFVESFDTISSAYARGWRTINASFPIGPRNWVNDGSAIPAFHSNGTVDGLLWTDYFSTAGDSIPCGATKRLGPGVISNWVVSPVITMQNGDKVIFYTRDEDPSFIDRLQVRMSQDGSSVNVGRGMDVGAFKSVLYDVNPFYLDGPPEGYPDNWTRFEATVGGLNGPTQGRVAFRYFLEEGGPGFKGCTGSVFADGSSVGLDSVAYVSISRKN